MPHIPEHVTDGELHAYLDGSLDALGEITARRVRRHLDGCEVCNVRLDEERGIRERASEILAAAAPTIRDVPPFEEIRRRAAADPGVSGGPPGATEPVATGAIRRARPGTLWTLGWAASLVVALGTGWMLRGGGADVPRAPTASSDARAQSTGTPDRDATEPTEVAEAAGTAFEDATAPAAAEADLTSVAANAPEAETLAEEPPGRFARSRLAEGSAASPPVAAADTEGSSERLADARAAPAPEQPRALAESAAKADEQAGGESPAGRLRDAADTLGERAARAEAAVIANAMDSVQLNEIVVTGAGGSAPAPREDIAEANRRGLNIEDGRRSDEAALTVPGFPVLSIRNETAATGELGIRILQQLPDGDTLELRYFWPAEAPAGLREDRRRRGPPPDLVRAPLRSGWSQVVIARPTGWLVARAPMERESLDFLLRMFR